MIILLAFFSLDITLHFNFVTCNEDFNSSPLPPNQDFSWNFTKGDIIWYKPKIYDNDTDVSSQFDLYDYIFNITDFGYDMFESSYYYYVNISYLNSKLEPHPFFEDGTESLINFTKGEMYLDFYQVSEPDILIIPPLNYFIPLNGSTLALDWCAAALYNSTYDYYFINTEVNLNINEIRYFNETDSNYFSLKYFDNGTLETFTFFYENCSYPGHYQIQTLRRYI